MNAVKLESELATDVKKMRYIATAVTRTVSRVLARSGNLRQNIAR
jgi:hypothetical protein